MSQILWTRHFLADQGVTVPVTTIYQDNKSTILLSENGKRYYEAFGCMLLFC